MTPGAELASWLRLALTPGLGPVSIRSLLKRFGHPERLLALPRTALAQVLSRDTLAALDGETVNRQVEASLDWASRSGHTVVTLVDETYPRRLLQIPDPPAILFVAGRVELLQRPALAVVGSRNATPQGLRTATQFSRALGAAGLTIVSGLAIGIDAAAHEGALGSVGSTLAILGTGIDIGYPARNAALSERILGEGALVSEFPLGAKPAAGNFPRRNRLISGMSMGCLVVEAALASGSLITAYAALEQGREVFAIPGSIHSPVARGCHALIKSGAKLVETADDVLSELNLEAMATEAKPRVETAPETHALLHTMGFDPVDIDTLCARTGRVPQDLTRELLELELAGKVAAAPGGCYQRLTGGGSNV